MESSSSHTVDCSISLHSLTVHGVLDWDTAKVNITLRPNISNINFTFIFLSSKSIITIVVKKIIKPQIKDGLELRTGGVLVEQGGLFMVAKYLHHFVAISILR